MKNAFPKGSLPTAALPKSALLFSLLLPCGEMDDGNSVVLFPMRPSFTSDGAASKAEAKAACCAVCFSSFLKLSRCPRREMLKTSLQEHELLRRIQKHL